MNWYIGQEIVARYDGPDNDFKKGDELVIHGLMKGGCSCGAVLIDVGVKTTLTKSGCDKHGYAFMNNGIAWYVERCFAPKQTLTESEEAYIKEFIEEVDSIPVENLFS